MLGERSHFSAPLNLTTLDGKKRFLQDAAGLTARTNPEGDTRRGWL
jgi:hypothetical protein